MTKPRTSTTREILGIIGALPEASETLERWNSFFLEEGMDACMDRYPTKETELPERLSEMFHFDRRGYIVGPALRQGIVPLLDSVEEGISTVDTVWNDGGVLRGYRTEHPGLSPDDVMRARHALWFGHSK